MVRSPELGPVEDVEEVVDSQAERPATPPYPDVISTDAITDESLKTQVEDVASEREKANEARANKTAAERLLTLEEVLESGARQPAEIIEVINHFSLNEIHQKELERKHGKGFFGNVRAWLRGDKDYYFDKGDKLKHSAIADLTRRATTSIFNRRTAVAGAVYGVAGVLTGGVGWVSGLALAGGVVGRKTVEAIDYLRGDDVVRGGTRGARKEIMLAEKERWYELQQRSKAFKHEQDPILKSELLQSILEIYHRSGEHRVLDNIAIAEKGLQEKEEKLAKLRRVAEIAGSAVGIGAGVGASVLSGAFEPIDLDFFDKVEGQHWAHGIVENEGVYDFVYTEAEKAAGMGGDALTHYLGEGAETTSNIIGASIVERGLPITLAYWLSDPGLTDGDGQRERELQYKADEQDRSQRRLGQVSEGVKGIRRQLLELAVNLGHKGLPESPVNFPVNWEKQDQLLPKDFDVDSLPQWVGLDQGGSPRVNSEGEFEVVGIVAVSPEDNLIAVTHKITHEQSGAKLMPINLIKLDIFLKSHREIVSVENGSKLGETGADPSIEPEGDDPSGDEGDDNEGTPGPTDGKETIPDDPTDPSGPDKKSTKRADERNEKEWRNKFLSQINEASGDERAVVNARKPGKEKSSSAGFKFPEDSKDFNKGEWFDWLYDEMPNIVGLNRLKQAGVEIGTISIDSSGKEGDFIRYIDSHGHERILDSYTDHEGRRSFKVYNKTDGHEKNFFASRNSINAFARGLFYKINTASKETPAPKEEAEVATPAEFKTGDAIWRNAGNDQPVVVEKYVGELNGRHYVQIEGSNSGVPLDEVTYDADPPAAIPPTPAVAQPATAQAPDNNAQGEKVPINVKAPESMGVVEILETKGYQLEDFAAGQKLRFSSDMDSSANRDLAKALKEQLGVKKSSKLRDTELEVSLAEPLMDGAGEVEDYNITLVHNEGGDNDQEITLSLKKILEKNLVTRA